MQPNNPYQAYSNQSVHTASKEELTLMLYNGAIKFANKAIICIEKNDIEGAHNNIMRVQEIIREFQITLDRSFEISHQLDVMYDYIHRRLVDGNIKKDADIINECVDLIREMRDTWKQAMVLAKKPGAK